MCTTFLNASEIITIIDKANVVQCKHLGSFCTILWTLSLRFLQTAKLYTKQTKTQADQACRIIKNEIKE